MKQTIRKIIPNRLILAYHFVVAHVANLMYRYPSRGMVVIGVIGTKGKTTTAALIAHILESAGNSVGLASSVQFKIGDNHWINKTKMGMLGRFRLQRMLREMRRDGVTHVVIETTTTGLKQHRHRGIKYDAVVYTNTSGMGADSRDEEVYKKTICKFVERVALGKPKKIGGKALKKALITTTDVKFLKPCLRLPFDKRWVIDTGVKTNVDLEKLPNAKVVKPHSITPTADGITFMLGRGTVEMPILGAFNALNATMALAIGSWLEIPRDQLANSLKTAPAIPGRMEMINEGQDFTVVIDDANEPKSIEAVYKAARLIADKKEGVSRVICVTGAPGDRDKDNRGVIGELAARHCDFVITTNEDPYDEDPAEIIEMIAKGVERGGKLLNNNFWKIENRREAVEKALSLANTNDVVIFTGKGAEQDIIGKKKTRTPYDERETVCESLRKIRE